MLLQNGLDLMLNKAAEKFHCRYSCHIENMKTGELCEYLPDEPVPSASLIKIVVMGEIMREVKDGELSLSQRIKAGKEDRVPFSIINLLDAGNSYTLADIIKLMIVQSDNSAANILIRLAGMDRVNEFAHSLGLKGTVLQRTMMDFEARRAGRENYTTAADMGRCLAALYRGGAVDAVSSKWMIDVMREQLDRSMMMLYLPDETDVAHKTGELENLDHDVGLVFTPAADYSFAVLVWNAPGNNCARFAIGEMSKICYEHFVGKIQVPLAL